MDEQAIRHLLTHLQVPHQKATFTGSVKSLRWMTVSCPFAPWTHQKKTDNNPSFGITIKPDGRSSYKCLSCGMHGRLAGLPTRLGGYRKRDYGKLRLWAENCEMQATLFKPVPKWEDADPVAIDYSVGGNDAIPDPTLLTAYPLALWNSYLRKRGIGLFDVILMNIRYDAYQRRVLFPVYDSNDRFRGFTGRSTLKGNDTTKGRNPKVRDYYGLNKRKVFLSLPGNRQGKKIVHEGLFDFAVAVHHGYRNARAILGTALTPDKIDTLISEGDPVYFFMDNDLAGWQALFGTFDDDEKLHTENAWAFRLYREIPVWIVPYKSNLTGEDPGSMLDKNVYDWHINNAWLFTGKPPLSGPAKPSMLPPKGISL